MICYMGKCGFNFWFMECLKYIVERIRERIESLSWRRNMDENVFGKLSEVMWEGFDFRE